MSNSKFHPPVELADHVIAYTEGLKHHKSEYGEVPENSPADLKPLVDQANKLLPLAQEIEDLELTLASKREAYNNKALPLWGGFSEKLSHAKVHAEKHHKASLMNFIRNYQHHTKGHAAAKASDPSGGNGGQK